MYRGSWRDASREEHSFQLPLKMRFPSFVFWEHWRCATTVDLRYGKCFSSCFLERYVSRKKKSLIMVEFFQSGDVWDTCLPTMIFRKLTTISIRSQMRFWHNRDSLTPLLNDLRWLSVLAMLALYDAILTFNCLRVSAPKYLSSRLNTRASVHGRN